MNLKGDEAESLALEAIRRWVAYSTDRETQLGLSVGEALQWARSVWGRPTHDGELILDSNLPDRLSALAKLALDDHGASATFPKYWFERVKAICWPKDPLAEKTQLLTCFAYASWRQLRRSGDFAEAQAWEARVVSLASSQPAIGEYLSLPAEAQSEQLGIRFLSDPAILLAADVRIRNSINFCPSSALRSALSIDAWLSLGTNVKCSEEEHHYFRARGRISVAFGLKHVGRYRDANAWLDRARESCKKVARPEPLLASIELVAVAIAYETRRYDDAVRRARALAEQFDQFGMRSYAARSRYVEALALKELQRDDEAARSFQFVASDLHVGVESWMRGMAFVGIAEICGRRGSYLDAAECLGHAEVLLGSNAPVIAEASLHGIRAEVQRRQGRLDGAISAYRAAIETYEQGGMEALAAYVRVVLAETFLAAGQEAASAAEIYTALPSIERLNLLREGIVAMALLRASLRRQEANPAALHALRTELERSRRESES